MVIEEAYSKKRAELADTFNNALKSKELTYVSLANSLKKDPANVRKEIRNKNLTFKTLLEYCEALDLEVIVRPKE